MYTSKTVYFNPQARLKIEIDTEMPHLLAIKIKSCPSYFLTIIEQGL